MYIFNQFTATHKLKQDVRECTSPQIYFEKMVHNVEQRNAKKNDAPHNVANSTKLIFALKRIAQRDLTSARCPPGDKKTRLPRNHIAIQGQQVAHICSSARQAGGKSPLNRSSKLRLIIVR